MRTFPIVLASSAVLAATATAKEFPPGGVMVCGATQCRVASDAQSRAFSDLLWGDRPVTLARTPRLGSPIYQLRFKTGPVGAIITATAIRVHGLRCGRFRRGLWYRLPPVLRDAADGLKPKPLRPFIPPSC
jgi:hypothetical protein